MSKGTIIFDLDDTLVDSSNLHCKALWKAMTEYGFDIPFESVEALVGKKREREIIAELCSPTIAEEAHDLKKKLIVSFIDKIETVHDSEWIIPELRKRGYKLALATSSVRSFTEAILEKTGWKFDVVITRDEVTHIKPDPEVLLRVKKELPGPYLFIGDHDYDRLAGKRAEIRTLIIGKDIKTLSELLDMDLAGELR